MRLSSISSIASSSILPRATAPIRRSLISTGSIPQFFNPSHNHQPFFRPSYRRFSAAPAIPLRLPTGSAIPHPLSTSATPEITIPKSLPKWLYGCSALVFGILVVGGLTRLTESGLSITEWEPITGILPPITQEQWDVEWEKYKVSPEGVLMNSKLEMSEFKKIFYMEWAHRIGGRLLGVGFVAPMIYYMSRYRLGRSMRTKLLALGLGIGFQGFLGWYMVSSGLEQEIIDNKAVPRVSQYRLAAHFSSALALYLGMLTTALQVSGIGGGLNTATPAPRRYKTLVHTAAGLVFLTAVSGAFVAGLDAGLVYNEFPTMGGRIVPPTDELLDKRYAKSNGDLWWRNMFENPVTAQFDHRVLATTTFLTVLSIPIIGRLPSVRSAMTRNVRRLGDLTAAAATAQVTLGITTLLYMVPVPLAALHQAGSVVLLSCFAVLLRAIGRSKVAVARDGVKKVLQTR